MTKKEEGNPLIEQYNYWQPYQESIDKLKQSHPETVQFAKLCYQVFETDAGRKLMETLEQKYLIPTMVKVGCSGYETFSVYSNGFKDALLLLRNAVIQHKLYINQNKG